MTTAPHWEYLAKWMLEALDGNPAEQERVLCGDKASICAALKAKGGKAGIFEGMDDREFIIVVETARLAVDREGRAYRGAS